MSRRKDTTELLKQALDLDTEARTEFLQQLDDSQVRSQLETLLGDEQQLTAFLKQNKPAVSDDHIKPGTMIKRIRIEKLLGEGGMGSVYLGFDEKLERQVAVKAIRAEHLKSPATHQRFVREAQIMSKINHPSICQLYDYVEDDLGDFLVMEFIDGEPLYKTPLDEAQKLAVLAALAGALEVAHEHGIVHRDLKPDNIMITRSGQVKVLDFGIAQSLTSHPIEAAGTASKQNAGLTQHGSLVGTIRYMSPEQAMGKSIDTASDIYAMGIIAQEIFAHQAAYEVLETEQLLWDVQQGKRQVMTGVAEPVVDLVALMTQIDADKRPTATDVLKRIGEIQMAPEIRQKRRLKMAAVALACVFLLVLIWQWLAMGNQANRNELIKSYENQIDDLVNQSEQIYVLPIHSVSEEINQILAQGEALYATIEAEDGLNAVDKLRLQGIIMLKAEYFDEAIELLEQGQAEAHLLADAWIGSYIDQAIEYSDQHGFDLAMSDQAFRQKYLEPALEYIKITQQQSGPKPLYQAFVMSQNESLETALSAVDEILSNERWNKDAVKLKALILSAMMQSARQNGQWEKAQKFGVMTAETYQLSAQMARSYPPTYQSLCYQQLNLMADAVQRTGDGVLNFAEEAKQACENALITIPSDPYPKHLLARIHMLLAQWQLSQGLDATDSLKTAAQWNEQTNNLNNVYDFNWNQALLLVIESKHLALSGQDGRQQVNAAVAILEKLMLVESAYKPYLIGDALYAMAQQAQLKIAHGADVTALFDWAQRIYDEAKLTQDLLVSEQWGLVTNMAEIHWMRLLLADLKQQDILPLGEQLLAFLKPADNVIKNEPHQLMKLANTHAMLAEHLHQNRQPIADHLLKAQENIQQAMAINANSYPILVSHANITSISAAITDQNFEQANLLFRDLAEAIENNPYGLLALAGHNLRVAQSEVSAEQQKIAREQGLIYIRRALEIDQDNRFFTVVESALLALVR
ncbi:serine/threonine-protein kinase [Marinicella sp. S1101]|uniref:serine/threonine-protein kinase n=1 Tax=Marinicella marina TaxID=2996016 RepID=UPI002260DC69|nr:serine/threonine-protein kinase [Marinicella marina]MCX7553375.1 serine/threonine-protein kinase [Marinicella marina]MDJ1139107.1 serine/threonine-protein kinase [Marinicella marina]